MVMPNNRMMTPIISVLSDNDSDSDGQTEDDNESVMIMDAYSGYNPNSVLVTDSASATPQFPATTAQFPDTDVQSNKIIKRLKETVKKLQEENAAQSKKIHDMARVANDNVSILTGYRFVNIPIHYGIHYFFHPLFLCNFI